MDLVKVLPLAFVMIAGPQIISAVFLATSDRWRGNSAAYVLGAALSISIVVSVAYLGISGVSERDGNDTVDIVLIALLAFLMVHTFRTRKTAEPPKWMGRLQTASPKLSFRLGFLLLGIFPTDIITSVTVGSYLSSHGDPWWHYLPFLGLTLLLLGLPGLLVLAMGRRAHELLPRVRDWMNDNSWIISEAVILFFIAIEINSLASG